MIKRYDFLVTTHTFLGITLWVEAKVVESEFGKYVEHEDVKCAVKVMNSFEEVILNGTGKTEKPTGLIKKGGYRPARRIKGRIKPPPKLFGGEG